MPRNTKPEAKKQEKPKTKKWTIMIFCAGDNALSPIIVSQLKDLKDAGRHDDVNVLVYFDANENGVPTRLYSINESGRNGHPRPCDTKIHNLVSDNVKIPRGEEYPAAQTLGKALKKPFEPKANDALSMFLAFCQEQYKARHYALVLVGHGMIVGNDAFLPDESPVSSITLKQLGQSIKGFGGKLELLALHSCSMSAVEVAYELKGKAKYMIASEGPAYVQGWPYRKLLQSTFEVINNQNGHSDEESEKLYVRELTEKLYKLSSSNGLDFMVSGYSQDLALINLDKKKFVPLTKAMKRLVFHLKRALLVPKRKQLIQLAHLESQSYFNESYTDLYDFCLCLSKNCNSDSLKGLKAACGAVMKVLEFECEKRFDKIVVHSRHFGSLYQHSHGLSIYFPWTEPPSDEKGSALGRYSSYKFTKAIKENHWLSFLKLYLKETKREERNPNTKINRAFSRHMGMGELSIDPAAHKTSGASGSTCSCVTIKNFPTVNRMIKGKCRRMPRLEMSPEFNQKDQ